MKSKVIIQMSIKIESNVKHMEHYGNKTLLEKCK